MSTRDNHNQRTQNERTIIALEQSDAVSLVAHDDPRNLQTSERLADMVIRDPAPDASPSRQPSGAYRIIEAVR